MERKTRGADAAAPAITALDRPSGSNLTEESCEGFPAACWRASLRDAHRNPLRNARARHRFLGGGEGPSDRSGVVMVFLDECVDWRLAA